MNRSSNIPTIYTLPKASGQLLSNQSFHYYQPYLQLYRYSKYSSTGNKITVTPDIPTCKSVPSGLVDSIGPKELLDVLSQRMCRLSEAMPSRWRFEFQPADKLAVGFGGTTPYGSINLMTLHPVYGVPYLPGSAIKGVLRHCWILEYCGGSEQAALQDKRFVDLFGAKGEIGKTNRPPCQGKLIVFDGFPLAEHSGRVDFDVMAPHFSDYYNDEGKVPPADDQNPVPVFFPCVKNAAFQILFGSRDSGLQEGYRQELPELVVKAFSQYGIGAKTALGYGVGTVKALKCGV